MSPSPELQARPALRRRTEERLVAGVAGGIADWLNASPRFVRIVLVLLFWLQPVVGLPVLWAYAAATLVLPARGHDRPGWDNVVGLARVGLIALTPQLVGLGGPGGGFDDSPVVWIPAHALMLVGLAVLLSADYLRGRARSDAETRAAVLAALPAALPVAAIVAGIVLLPDVRWERYLPVAVVVAGCALLAGAWAGRPRPFLTPAVVTAAVAANLVAAGARLEGGVGDTHVVPGRLDDGDVVVRRAAGDVIVDLRRASSAEPIVLRASVGRGSLRVALPNRLPVAIDVRVGEGSVWSTSVDRSGSEAEGFDLDQRERWRPRFGGRPPAPSIRVIADVGIGVFESSRGRDFQLAGTAP